MVSFQECFLDPHLNTDFCLYARGDMYWIRALSHLKNVWKKQNKKGMGTICIIQIRAYMRDAAAAVISPIFCSIPLLILFFQCQG